MRGSLWVLCGFVVLTSGVSAAPIDDWKASARKAAAVGEWASAAHDYEQALKTHAASRSETIDLELDATGARMMAGDLAGARARLKSIDPKQCSAEQARSRHGLSASLRGRGYYTRGARRAAELSKESDPIVVSSFLEYWAQRQPRENVRKYAVEQLEYAVQKFGYRADTAFLASAISVKADLPLGQILTQISRDCSRVSKSWLFQTDYGMSVSETEPLMTLACYDRALTLSKTARERASTLSRRSMALAHGGKLDDAMRDAKECLKIAEANHLDDLKDEANERIATVNRWKALSE